MIYVFMYICNGVAEGIWRWRCRPMVSCSKFQVPCFQIGFTLCGEVLTVQHMYVHILIVILRYSHILSYIHSITYFAIILCFTIYFTIYSRHPSYRAFTLPRLAMGLDGIDLYQISKPCCASTLGCSLLTSNLNLLRESVRSSDRASFFIPPHPRVYPLGEARSQSFAARRTTRPTLTARGYRY